MTRTLIATLLTTTALALEISPQDQAFTGPFTGSVRQPGVGGVNLLDGLNAPRS